MPSIRVSIMNSPGHVPETAVGVKWPSVIAGKVITVCGFPKTVVNDVIGRGDENSGKAGVRIMISYVYELSHPPSSKTLTMIVTVVPLLLNKAFESVSVISYLLESRLVACRSVNDPARALKSILILSKRKVPSTTKGNSKVFASPGMIRKSLSLP